MKIKFFLIWLASISLLGSFFSCTTSEDELCAKAQAYTTKLKMNLEDDGVLLVASDKYCTPCFETALIEVSKSEYSNVYIILNGSSFPKSMYNLLNSTFNNFNVVVDNQRNGESYFSLAKPIVVFYENSKCALARSLTDEVIDEIF